MMRKKTVVFILMFFAVFAGGLFLLRQKGQLEIGWSEKRYLVEEALTNREREKGLGGRESLCSRCGMLFVFPKAGKWGFWMKGMHFPLDMIWLSHGMVVHIERNVRSDSEEVFTPQVPADQVLEVNAGEASDLSEGDIVTYFR